jgi:pyroglutamyl-peptidase
MHTKPVNYRFLLGKFACLAAILTLGCYLSFRGAGAVQPEPTPQVVENSGKRPVILLTGFEPFGDKRPNISWEGIKELDGQRWKDYQIVCKLIPVVWGEPLRQLQELISLYQPVAIFSFGQGKQGSFAFESKASVERGNQKDNREERPKSPTIVEEGPKQFDATIDCEKFAHLLAVKGYPTRVSNTAGKYLCEEMLYTLEYLKASRKLDTTVMFCHVPPINTTVGEQKITPEYAKQFVQDVLLTWTMLYQGETPKAKEAKQQEIKEFIGRYFSTWSAADMKGYDACFLPDAVIQHIDGQGRLSTTARVDFIASQRDYHRTAPHKTTEVAESIDIRVEEKLVRVVVFWKLTAGPRLEYGYDHFTLLKLNGQWRIVNLVFYSTPPMAKKK